MSGKLPWMQFFPADWTRDTLSLSLPARGAWISLVCAMWDAKPRGKLTMSIEAYGRVLGVSKAKTSAVIKELSDRKVCNCVTLSNGDVTLICRRQVKDEKHRESTRCRVEKHRNAHVTTLCNVNVTPYISEVRSQKSEVREEKSVPTARFIRPAPQEVTEYAKSKNINLDGEVFCSFYESNGWKVGRNPMRSWKAAVTGTWKNGTAKRGIEGFASAPRKLFPDQALKLRDEWELKRKAFWNRNARLSAQGERLPDEQRDEYERIKSKIREYEGML